MNGVPGLGEIVRSLRVRLGPGLRSLFVFGSWLSPALRKATSIPDLFALVDDVDQSLARLGEGRAARLAARVLPPVTLAFRAGKRTVAKVNLITPESAGQEIERCQDLYVAGRFSKRTSVVHARDAACRRELASLFAKAQRRVAALALLDAPRRTTVEDVVRRCVAISYQAEIRPEANARRQAVFEAFAEPYRRRFGPLVFRAARRAGVQVSGNRLVDDRAESVRRREAASLRLLLRRARVRTALRWPKQMLVFRGWLPYLVGKVRRR